MPSIWVSEKDYTTLMRIRACLQKINPKRNVSMPKTVSVVLESTTIPAIPLEKDDEIIKRVRILVAKSKFKAKGVKR